MNYLQIALQKAQQGNSSHINYLGYSIGAEQQKVVSHVMKNKIWYVDIPRTSSTSIQMMLGDEFGFPYGKEHVPGSDVNLGVSSVLLPPHSLAIHVREFISGHYWDDLRTFSIVRDPYSWSLSFWNYTKEYAKTIFKGESFKDFLLGFHERLALPKENRTFFPSNYMQSDYLTDEQGKFIVKDILKFEDRVGINEYLAEVGVKRIIDEKFVPSKNKGYEMTREERNLIETIFEKDFDLLGY